MAIADDDIERVRSTVSIVDVIGQYVALRKAGRNWVGLCPFHAERTPSFNVREETGRYQCFGCDKGGDVFTFVQEHEHVDFVGAVEYLAAKAGIQLTYTTTGEAKRAGRRKRLVEAMGTAVEWYHDAAEDPAAREARDYLPVAGLDGDVARQFKLGWAPDDWDALVRVGHRRRPAARRRVWRSPTGATACRTRSGRGCCSRSSPTTGEAVAIGGRVLPGCADPAKYKNSPETPIYAKSKTLYGLNWSKADIVNADQVVVCEGYTDVIGFHRVGIPRAVATCGTAFTEDHVRLLKRYASKVVLAFDADAAGQGAAERFYEWEQRYQVQVSVARLPDGKDPGELSLRDPDALVAAVAGAVPFLAFRLQRVMDGRPARTPEDRARLAERAMAVVNEHPDGNVRKLYAGQVASEVGLPSPTSCRSPSDAAGSRPSLSSRHAGRRFARTPSSSPSPCSPRTGSRSPGGSSRSCSTTRRTGERSSRSPMPAATSSRRSSGPTQAREVLERAAVADLDVDPEAEACNLIGAAVRRQLAERAGIGDIEHMRDDAQARLQLEDAGASITAASAAEWLLGWLHRRMEEGGRGGP